MLTSISPLGERARGNRFWRTAAAYVAGSLAGGTVIGAALGLAGSPLDLGDGALVTVAAAALVGVVLDVRRALPTPHRQVDERWLATYRGWVYGAGYGFQLGLGVVTIVTASTTYVALLAAALAGSAAGGAIVGATFGAARALPLLVTARVGDADDLARLHRRVAEAARSFAAGTKVAQSALAVAALFLLGVGA
jgi:hypothetical protein